MKEKKAKENQGDDRHQFSRIHAPVVFKWMKERKAEENRSDDRHQFYQVREMIAPTFAI